MKRVEARKWLRANGYDDVADLIDEVMLEWQNAGIRTRRNWWDLLAGTSKGEPSKIGDKEFPILTVAQIRQGRPLTPNSISRNPSEEIPPFRATGRWVKKKRKTAEKTNIR
jgi:hypothetical protein